MDSAARGPTSRVSATCARFRAASLSAEGARFAACTCAFAASFSSLTRDVIHSKPCLGTAVADDDDAEGKDGREMKPRQKVVVVVVVLETRLAPAP